MSLPSPSIFVLNRFSHGTKAADACQRRVVAGPVEATAIGNVMMQAVADGAVGSIAQARDVIRDSCDVIEYLPQKSAAWDEAYGKVQRLTK